MVTACYSRLRQTERARQYRRAGRSRDEVVPPFLKGERGDLTVVKLAQYLPRPNKIPPSLPLEKGGVNDHGVDMRAAMLQADAGDGHIFTKNTSTGAASRA